MAKKPQSELLDEVAEIEGKLSKDSYLPGSEPGEDEDREEETDSEQEDETSTTSEDQEEESDKDSKTSKDEEEETDDESEDDDESSEDEDDSEDSKADKEEEESEDDDSEDEDSEDDEDADDESDSDTKHLSPAQIAFQKRKLNREYRQKLADLERPKSEEQQQDLEAEVAELAAKIKGKTTAEQLKEILVAARKKANLPTEMLETLTEAAREAAERREANLFRKEWDGLVPELKKLYPNASDKQLSKAMALMNELSHTVGIGGKLTVVNGKKVVAPYDLDYIMTKNQDKFKDVLFSPKRKSAESGSLGEPEADESSDKKTLPKNIDSPKSVEEAEAFLNKASDDAEGGFHVNRGGKKVRVG